MTEEHIKEELSRLFVSALAAVKGILASKPERDYGVDLRLEKVETYQIGRRTRYVASGQAVDVQLKATSAQRFSPENGVAKFDLAVENFNDLIRRRYELDGLVGGHAPLVLIVLYLPENQKVWLRKEEEGIFLSGRAFWFYPPAELDFSTNSRTQRIQIPLKNEVNLEFFDNLFNLLPKSYPDYAT